ncbi:hypothetical protein DPQ33_06760 [Oceanidesulfovibrio indonesiensis]|uniref:Glycosyltransferase family 1 protein n=1 Tax=Oceanidesulfovibrio indonesiensis TaxID=54767 RepID=A0A7M3MGR6_9BACT|nr:hypothetical protein [Oceanidesulfovibrio indonesiensis]TVM18439.1 hypothetical protein DPQ33_06760 [Oceanidesulfovibrio indonesiensis]
MSKRILIGTHEIAKNVINLAAGFRELGYETDSLVYNANRFYGDSQYTLRTVGFLEDTTYHTKADGTVGIKTSRKFAEFVKKYDIFIFIAGSSLLPRLVDLPVLRQMGKTIISRHCGTEVRDAHLARIFWEDYGRRYPFYERDLNAPKADIRCENDLLPLGRYHPGLASKLHNARTSELYADLVTCGPPSHTLALRPYVQTGPPIDLRDFRFRIPRRRVPVIVHAPSSMEYKQTDSILRMLDELLEEGVRFHLDLLHEVPNEVVRQKLTDADIVIDELSCGSGVLAYEGAAAGCAVLSGHDGVSSPLPRNRPVLNIDEGNFKDRVRKVVENIDYRTHLAVKGREYVNSGIGSPASIAACLLNALERAESGDSDLYPTLFTERCFMPESESIPEYLRQRTLKIVGKHGVHPSTDIARLVREGFIPDLTQEEMDAIPRWNVSKLKQEGPWILTGPGAVYGSSEPVVQPEEFGRTSPAAVS